MSDVIAAIATAPVPSAIGILRLSGPGCAEVLDQVFTPFHGVPMSARPDRQLVYGILHDREGRAIDQCLATLSRGPHSYTGEDTAELQCHGSPTALALGLDALFAAGARQAQAGEFTRRAFLSGRLDLTQVEAVADLIHAGSAGAVYQAAGQLGGALSQVIGQVYDRLTDLMAHFHAVLDYPDEDIDPFEAAEISTALPDAAGQLNRLAATYRRGRAITAPLWAGPTRANPPCSTPCLAMSGPSSLPSPALPGTRWRSGLPWGAPCCGSSTPPGCGILTTPWSSWGWSAAGPPWSGRS